MGYGHIRVSKAAIALCIGTLTIFDASLSAFATPSNIVIRYYYDASGNRKNEIAADSTALVNGITLNVSTTTVNQYFTVSAAPGGPPNTLQTHISATATGGTPPYVYQWIKLSGSGIAFESNGFSLQQSSCATTLCGNGSSAGGDTGIFQSSCPATLDCTMVSEWEVQVTDQNGNGQTSAPITITHTYSETPYTP